MEEKICKSCFEPFGDWEGSEYCVDCEREMKAEADDICLSCGGHGVVEGNWGRCENCN